MKKLMITAAVALVAGMSMASTIRWSANTIKDTTGEANAGNTYMALCFLSSGSTKDIALDTAISKLKAGTLTANDAVASKTLTGGVLTMTTAQAYDGNWGEGDSITGYAIILDNTDISKAKNFYVLADANNDGANEMSYTFGSGNENTQFAFGKQANTAASWQSIPEPTSGLLLLLGVADLALRRRRA